MRKGFVLSVTLLACVCARRHHHMPSRSRANLPEEMQDMKRVDSPDHSDPFSDPIEDIPDRDEIRRNYFPKNQKPGNYNVPRDIYEYERRKFGDQLTKEKSKDRARMWFDFVSIHDRNIQKAAQSRRHQIAKPPHKIVPDSELPPNLPKESKIDFFSPHTFGLKQDFQLHFKPIKWTTCDEFGRGAKFDPEDIMNRNWIPFYMWTTLTGKPGLVHRFTRPSIKTVKEYSDKYGKYVNKTIDWLQSKLLFTEGDKEDSLLIAADRKGLYYSILNRNVPDFVIRNNITLPTITIRLKILNTYLAIMHCDEKLAYIMALENDGPQKKQEKIQEAAKLNFKGVGRPVSRNIALEQKIAEMDFHKKKLQDSRKYLPVKDPNHGLFPPELRDLPPTLHDELDSSEAS